MMDLRLQPELHRGLRLNLNSAKSESQTLPKSHIAQWVQSQAQPELHRSLRLKLSSIVVTICSVGGRVETEVEGWRSHVQLCLTSAAVP